LRNIIFYILFQSVNNSCSPNGFQLLLLKTTKEHLIQGFSTISSMCPNNKQTESHCTTPVWLLLHTHRAEISTTNLNHRKKIKAERSRLISLKLTPSNYTTCATINAKAEPDCC